MLKQNDKYSIIAINPFTEFGLNIPIEAFSSQFKSEFELRDIENKGLKKILHQEILSDDELKNQY